MGIIPLVLGAKISPGSHYAQQGAEVAIKRQEEEEESGV